MNISEVSGFEATGFVIRTTNADEVDPSTAKIGELWAKFDTNAAPNLTENQMSLVFIQTMNLILRGF